MKKALAWLLGCCLLQPALSWGWFWQDSTLVEINNRQYTQEDYLEWWQHWQEPEMDTPQNPESFINFHLKVMEARAMGLQDRPSYQHKLKVFLKVRSLMALRQEEIGEKIGQPSRKQLWRIYQQEYAPLFSLDVVRFGSYAAARDYSHNPKSTQKALLKRMLPYLPWDTPATFTQLNQGRPRQLPPSLVAQARSTREGHWSPVFLWQGYWHTLRVADKVAANQQDFAQVKDSLKQQWRQQRQSQRNREFMAQLKDKYQVQVYWDRIHRLTPEGVPESLQGQAALAFKEQQVPLESIHKAAQKEFEKRHSKRNRFTFKQATQIVVNNMVAQTVTGMEALNRNYQQQEPLKSTFTFYQKYRLVKELEAMVIPPEKLSLSEEELRQAYEKQKKRFQRPEILKVLLVKTQEQHLARQLKDKLKQGEPFNRVMAPLKPRRLRKPIDHFDPALKPLLQKMQTGETATTREDGTLYFVKLEKRTPPRPVAFKKVAPHLRKELRQQRRQDLLQQLHQSLRQGYDIEIHDPVWQRVQQELNNAQT